jgi:predicted metal-binding membrane protein
VLRRDRAVVISAILIIAAIAWGYTVYLAETGMGDGMSMGMAMADMRSWSVADFALMFVMWAVMMVAMMAPSAAPMLLMFASLNRKRREREAPYVPTAVFLAGYLIVWTVFAAAATGGNWGLHQASLLSSMMGASTSGYLGGALLLAAGAFQWSPLKYACLKQCRTPMGFLMTSWREGHQGALRMGLEHGAYCLGCCWSLMLLLFVLGVMNLVWIAALAAFVLAEKVAPKAEWVSRATGVLLIGWGIWAIITTAL